MGDRHGWQELVGYSGCCVEKAVTVRYGKGLEDQLLIRVSPNCHHSFTSKGF